MIMRGIRQHLHQYAALDLERWREVASEIKAGLKLLEQLGWREIWHESEGGVLVVAIHHHREKVTKVTITRNGTEQMMVAIHDDYADGIRWAQSLASDKKPRKE